ncbi:MAG: B12-binding domain-containing radical SAM protein, partial [Gemmatimonadota bacterium]
ILDENLEVLDYESIAQPTLVGITAFTCQAPRAYQVAAAFRKRGTPVVMGGIHASMRPEEALRYVDSVVVGEAETVWTQVLDDVLKGNLQELYRGSLAERVNCPPARHDLVNGRYPVATVQTTRGCPLNCHFCSVTAFNGRRYRRRPIRDVIHELQLVPERLLFFADDNLIGTRKDHIEYAKDLFRSMIAHGIKKRWAAQVTINVADDAELLNLAKKSGCIGVYIGFESPNPESLKEVNKTFNLRFGIEYYEQAVRRLHEAGIGVTGAFIMGIDHDKPGAANMIVDCARRCQIDAVTVLTLTPLPGTVLYEKMDSDRRIILTTYPDDWKCYNLIVPTCRFKHFSWSQLKLEREILYESLYRKRSRLWMGFLRTLLATKDLRVSMAYLISNLSYRRSWHIYDAMRARFVQREEANPAALQTKGLDEE